MPSTVNSAAMTTGDKASAPEMSKLLNFMFFGVL